MDKLCMTLGWLVGRRIAGQRSRRNEAVVPMCSYNGVVLPPLPSDWDREAYPYAVICYINSSSHQLFISSELPYVNTNGSLHFSVPGCCDNQQKQYRWDDLGYFSSDYDGFGYGMVVWSNFDLCYEDGTLVCAASEPVPTPLPYVIEALFDGEVTTADDGNGVYVSDKFTSENAGSFSSVCAYRVTIDGITTVKDIVSRGVGYPSYLGNAYLVDSENFEDNGGTWCIRTTYTYSTKVYSYILQTREPGTYHLKLESVRA